MNFGITSSGFNIMRLPDVKEDTEKRLTSRFGSLDLAPESVIGQFVGITSKIHADLWEQLGNVYQQRRPSSAYGLPLDDLVEINGISRLPATHTRVDIGLNGTFNTIVPIKTQIKSYLTNDIYELIADSVISNEDRLKIYVTIDTVLLDTDYTLTIDTTDYIINSGGSPSKEIIANALIDEINNDPTAIVTATDVGAGGIQLESKTTNTFNTFVDGNMSYWTPAAAQAVDTGEKLALEDSLTIIETPVSGLDNVNNFEVGVKGRERESDSELRLRRTLSLQKAGAGPLPAIVARIQDEVESVTNVKGFENRNDVVDIYGRPPHSFEIVVLGGLDSDIGNKLWEVKPGGIQTFGNSFYDITDSNGDLQRMFFSRPVNKYAWVEVDITLYDEEEFPPDGLEKVEEKILSYGNTFEIGLDIIPGRFKGPIYEIPGIDTIAVRIAVTDMPGGIPVYQTTKIAISSSEIAIFDLLRIHAEQI